jgi:hypothetical protein
LDHRVGHGTVWVKLAKKKKKKKKSFFYRDLPSQAFLKRIKILRIEQKVLHSSK